jgi:hypothetical protein
VPEENERPVGLTRESGWQTRVRRILPAPCNEVWHLPTLAAGLRSLARAGRGRGSAYQLENGTPGTVRVYCWP